MGWDVADDGSQNLSQERNVLVAPPERCRNRLAQTRGKASMAGSWWGTAL
jgi:hypothetical protein